MISHRGQYKAQGIQCQTHIHLVRQLMVLTHQSHPYRLASGVQIQLRTQRLWLLRLRDALPQTVLVGVPVPVAQPVAVAEGEGVPLPRALPLPLPLALRLSRPLALGNHRHVDAVQELARIV